MDKFIYRFLPESFRPKINDSETESHDTIESQSSEVTTQTSLGDAVETESQSDAETVKLVDYDTSTTTVYVAQYNVETSKNKTEDKTIPDAATNKTDEQVTSDATEKDTDLKNGDKKTETTASTDTKKDDAMLKGESKTNKKDTKKKKKEKASKKSKKDEKDSKTDKDKDEKKETTKLAKGDGATKTEDSNPEEESKKTSNEEPKPEENTEENFEAEAAKLLKAMAETENEETEAEAPVELLDRWRPTMEWGVEEPEIMKAKLIPDHLTIMEKLVKPPATKDPSLHLFKGIRPPGGFFEKIEDQKKKKVAIKKKKQLFQSKNKGAKSTGLDEQTQVSDDEIEAEMNKDEKGEVEEEDDDLSEFMNQAQGDTNENNEGDGESSKGYSAFTGMFRDGIRRIDYILVTSDRDDPEEEKYKVDFLTSLVKLGLQLQFERGRQKNHRHLYFIKVHAPDHVLDEFAEPLGVKKFFKDSHLRHYGANRTWDEFILSPSYEKTWIKLVRQSYIRPLQYSNHERSLIVYMLLRHQPFGTRRNHFGLQRLLNHSIILDAYALHDGPYFFVKDQDYLRLNARQILHYNWIGAENAFRYQPKNLIHEYYGPKIAFFFSYYEFYNRFLVILSIFGVLTFALLCTNWNSEDSKIVINNFYKDIYNHVCEEEKRHVCPECRNLTLCPLKKFKTYCSQVLWANFFDSNFTLFYCIIITFWAPLFYVYWRRQESYRIWLWELKYRKIEPVVPIVRSEYRANFNIFFWRAKDGRWADDDQWFFRFLRYLAGAVVAFLFIFILFAVYYHYLKLHLRLPGEINLEETEVYEIYDENTKKTFKYTITGTHKILAGLTALFYVLLFTLEKLYQRVTQAMIMVENHRLQRDHEYRQVALFFAISCVCVFPIVAWFGWIKGAFTTLPYRLYSTKYNISLPSNIKNYTDLKFKNITKIDFDWPAEIFKMNCGFYTCTDKLLLVLVVLFTLRIVVWRIVHFIPCWKTDYTKNEEYLKVTPSWEREFRLKNITEVQIVKYYNELVIQLAILVYLSPWFPLMPIIALVINSCDIKHKARLFLLHSRRPTLFQTEGIMKWNSILQGIIFSTPLIHAITLVRNSKSWLWYTYLKFHQPFFIHGIEVNKTADGKPIIEPTKLFQLRLFDFVPYTMSEIEIGKLKNVTMYNNTINEHLNLTFGDKIEEIPDTCFFKGIYKELTLDQYKFKMPYPFHWNNITDNLSNFTASSAQFFNNLHETFFIIGYSHAGLFILLLILYYIPQEITRVKQFIQMEKILKKVHILNKVKIPADKPHRPPLKQEINQSH